MTDTPPLHDGFGEVVAQPRSRIQRIVAKRLHDAWTSIPHVTHHEEADVTELEKLRIRRQADNAEVKWTLLAFVARACVEALSKFPNFCASLSDDGGTLFLKRYVNLGIAVETPGGLVVAVVPQAQGRSVGELAIAIQDLASRGRAGRLLPSEVEGSSFTLSSLANLGGVGFTPIINPPNVAILGLATARVRPQWIDGGVQPRLTLPMSLSYDHRAIDGADAARFSSFLRSTLEDPERIDR